MTSLYSGDIISTLAAIAIILAILAPIWVCWLGFRLVRHLYHIETALWQIRDALRDRVEVNADRGSEVTSLSPRARHVANSMFGR